MLDSILSQFRAYNRNLHSHNPSLTGGNHSNISTSKTTYMFADEYREPKKGVVTDKAMLARNSTSTVKTEPIEIPGAEGDQVSKMSNADQIGSAVESSTLVDLSNMSQNEFDKLRNTLRRGEPNNRVNF